MKNKIKIKNQVTIVQIKAVILSKEARLKKIKKKNKNLIRLSLKTIYISKIV